MNPLVCLVSLVTVAMLAMLLPTLTSGTPLGGVVEPSFALEDMESDHACLFICNLCFTDVEDTDKLMACSNKVCGDKCAFEKFIWLGHHCRHYNMVEMMWSSSKHARIMNDQYPALA